MSKQLWTLDRGPFGWGMMMCDDGLYINPEYGGTFKVTGTNLRIKQIKQRLQLTAKTTIKVPKKKGSA